MVIGLSKQACWASDETTNMLRLSKAWTYDKLNDEATFVVIAMPTGVTVTSERAALPGIFVVRNYDNIIGIGVETEFDVLAVLKGDRNIKTFVFHHYRLADADQEALWHNNLVISGPLLVSFEPKDEKTYLLFLRLEEGGRYVAVSGQTDSFLSVQQFTVDSVFHESLRARVKTAEQAATQAMRLANDEAFTLYHSRPFQAGQAAQFVGGHWIWSDRRGFGHGDIQAAVELAADCSTNHVDLQLLNDQNPNPMSQEGRGGGGF